MLRITTAAPRFLPERANGPGLEAVPFVPVRVDAVTVEDLGYAATGRIERVQPRVTALQARRTVDDGSRAVPVERDDATPTAEFDGEPFGDWIGDRLAGLRDAWSQTTFFLTDPNSWR